jgi:hypothetical protein
MRYEPETEVADRRRATRLEPCAGVRAMVFDAMTGQSWSAAIRDISQSGIALLVDQAFTVGQLLGLELKLDERRLVRNYLVEVRHSDICCPNDSYLHGCQFVEPLREEEWRIWL